MPKFCWHLIKSLAFLHNSLSTTLNINSGEELYRNDILLIFQSYYYFFLKKPNIHQPIETTSPGYMGSIPRT